MTKHRTPEEMRGRIFRAFDALMKEKTYESITTREIASRADVSYTALYTYFGSKENLLCEFCDEYSGLNNIEICDVLKQMPPEDTQGISPEQLALMIVDIFFTTDEGLEEAAADLNMASLSLRNPEVKKRYKSLERRWFENIKRAIEYCNIETDDVEAAIRYIESLVDGVGYHRVLHGKEWPMQDVFRYVSELREK